MLRRFCLSTNGRRGALAYDEDDANESSGDAECEIPKLPKNDQDRCDYPEHL